MTYTPEGLREDASTIEREGKDADEVDSQWLIRTLRDHAAALEENARLREALAASMLAIDDWLNTYASDMCDAQRVIEARARIAEYGTIGYIAHVQGINRAAIKSNG